MPVRCVLLLVLLATGCPGTGGSAPTPVDVVEVETGTTAGDSGAPEPAGDSGGPAEDSAGAGDSGDGDSGAPGDSGVGDSGDTAPWGDSGGTGWPDWGDSGAPSCEDTCRFADDGACDDGGPGSTSFVCRLGTDCTDCGPR